MSPDHVDASTLLLRMASPHPMRRMPPIGVSVVDVDGLTVNAVSDWYAGDDPAFLADAGADVAIVSWDGGISSRPKTVGSECPHVM